MGNENGSIYSSSYKDHNIESVHKYGSIQSNHDFVTKNGTIKNRLCSYWLEMDKFTSDELVQNYLGDNCFQDQTEIDLKLIGRGLMFGSKHWGWLFTFKDHSTYEYATVEYADQGILLGIYEKELNLSLYDICTTYVGFSNTIEFTDEFKTNKNWGDILKKITHMKNVYTAKKYNMILFNCRVFARDLGGFLTKEFINSKYNSSFDQSFPSKMDYKSVN